MGKLKDGDKIANLFGTLRRAFGMAFLPKMFLFAMAWYNTLHYLGQQTGELGDRAKFVVWLSWAISFWVVLETLWAVAEVAMAASAKNTNKAKTYQQTSNPAGGSNAQLSYDAFAEENAFLLQQKGLALAKPLSTWTSTYSLVRWVLIIFVYIIFNESPTFTTIVCLIIEILALVFVIASLPSFHKPLGILIMVSEILQVLRNIVVLLWIFDQAADESKFAEGLVNIFTQIVLWSLIFQGLIELAIAFMGIGKFPGESTGSPENADSSDIKLDLESQNELGNKISTYKSMKSGKVTAQNPGPAGNNATNNGQTAPTQGQTQGNTKTNGQTAPTQGQTQGNTQTNGMTQGNTGAQVNVNTNLNGNNTNTGVKVQA